MYFEHYRVSADATFCPFQCIVVYKIASCCTLSPASVHCLPAVMHARLFLCIGHRVHWCLLFCIFACWYVLLPVVVYCRLLLCIVVCSFALSLAAVHCRLLLCIVACCCVLWLLLCIVACCCALPSAVVHSRLLLCIAVCCCALPSAIVHCRLLLCSVVCSFALSLDVV